MILSQLPFLLRGPVNLLLAYKNFVDFLVAAMVHTTATIAGAAVAMTGVCLFSLFLCTVAFMGFVTSSTSRRGLVDKICNAVSSAISKAHSAVHWL